MKIISNIFRIFRYVGLPLSCFALSMLQAAQISDKEYLQYYSQGQTSIYDDCKDDEKINNQHNENNQDKLNKAFLDAARKGDVISLKTLKNKGVNVYAKDKHGRNALHLAALYARDDKIIIWLIDQAHIPIESKDYYQQTPFLCAALKGNLSALKFLKTKGANVYAKNRYGNNALHYAAGLAPEGKGIAWLINETKIAIESKGRFQKTPFLIAAEKGNLASLKILKNKGAHVKAIDEWGNNALHYAAGFAPEGKGIAWLIDEAKIPIESKGRYQKTSFLIAAENGNLASLKILKNKGAHVKAIDEYGNNALHHAVSFVSNGQVIEWLLHTVHMGIESKGGYQMTPFLVAAENGNLSALKLLKREGAYVKAIDEYGNNALHYAASFSSTGQGIEWLLDEAHIPIESKGQYQMTSFLMAAQNGNLTSLKILKNKGAHVKATDKNGRNALHYAALYAREETGIAWLINEAHIPIESKGQYHKTAFLMAAQRGNLPALKVLKTQKANVGVTDEYGNNALHYAVLYGSEEGIAWLISEAHISVESAGRYKKVPFLIAAEKGNLSILKILKEQGANVRATDEYGNNALHYATLYAPEAKGVAWLIEFAKIPIESKGYYQKTSFLMAAERGNLPVLELLKTKGASVVATDKDGNNALHYATLYAPEGKGVAWLIDKAKIPIESKGQYDKTPFLCAAEKGNLPALEILKKKGANTNATDQYGSHALWYAKNYSSSQQTIDWLQDVCGLT